ncbi:hypothetical protein CDA63_03240 [Hymenobacter amundsenii]|uniref:Carboxypeptidase-like regulatory domain-containing protein n=1 Tax=Hymenobacter amundsenii TaxID=2006685 RepID=A0A246FNQ9_9BACT|nr:carboxypeptidase-like regulatory domain-containing protein [Hymenobacter amundsenii]OWP64406.1 hypothetical protein CDA63_03240 [Hymenobacter amundsenii]
MIRYFLPGFILLLLLGLNARPAQAQFTVSGVARDSLSREPLGFASVFLAKTTYGTITDEAGRFTLSGVAPGSYDLVVSYLGYRLYQLPVQVRGPLTVNPLLAPLSTQLQEVLVQARRHRNDPAALLKFKQLFLGTSSFSRQCKILNEEDIVVDFDPKRSILTASSSSFVKVENQALGYVVTYYGLRFEADLNQQTVIFLGKPGFTELPARNARRQQQWQQNRRTAYIGSLTHFLRAVHNDQLTAQGFLAQRTHQVFNIRRARADSLLKQQRAAAGGKPFDVSDSLMARLSESPAYLYLYTRPLPADSLRRRATDGTYQLRFRDQVQVTYQAEKPDPRYQPASPLGGLLPPATTQVVISSQSPPTPQVSTLYLLQPGVRLLPDGQLAEPLAIFTEGYWAFEKMGEFLPLDYAPNLPPVPAQKP